MPPWANLSDSRVPIKKRLFFTAPPRHYNINQRDEEGDFKFVSMDDPTVYGPRAHTLTFSRAAKVGIICGYKVIISLINKTQVDDFAFRNGLTLVDGDQIGIKWVANELAIQQAVEKTNATRIITFHSRVNLAKEFASDSPRGIDRYLNDFNVFHVNGEQRSSDREDILHAFRDAPKGLITNARCLTEGIDVPAVDLVAFIDPRQSKIDIVQATGRAMRRSDKTNKTVGYIVVPLFVDSEPEDDIENELQGGKFEEIVTVLNALQEQDDDLADIIRNLREERGRGEVFNPRVLGEKIAVIGEFVSLEKITESIDLRIVDRIGSTWDEMYGRLVLFQKRTGHCRVPRSHKTDDDFRLGEWVKSQRGNKEKLNPDRLQRLEALPGWSWDPFSDVWEEGFSHLKQFSDREGHCRVPDSYKTDGYRLGGWCSDQRANKEKMNPDRLQRLEGLPGWSWDPVSDLWEEGFSHLRQFSEREGHCRVPRSYETNGYRLGGWVKKQRSNKQKINPDRLECLEALPGWSWDPHSDQLEEGFSHLQQFSDRQGHCRVAAKYKTDDGYRLGSWVNTQRSHKETMDPERRQRLEVLPGWSWDAVYDQWEEGISHLKQFSDREGHCRTSGTYRTDDGYRLGQWVKVQRRNIDTMEPDRRQRLESLPGWSWNFVSDDLWEEGFAHLKQFSEREGHCRISRRYKSDDGYRLGQWIAVQRRNIDTMESDRRQRLEALPGWSWDVLSDSWEEGSLI